MEKIFIAPRQMHKNLLSLSRKDDFFMNPKILTKEEFLEKYYGRISNEGLYNLLRDNDITYENLMELVPYIPRSNELCERNKNIDLYNFKLGLIKDGLLEKDEFFSQFIKDKEFEIFGYSEKDYELISLLNARDIHYIFNKLPKTEKPLTVKNFPLIEDEIFYMLNEIARLLDNGISPEDIYIYTSEENVLFYIKKYYASFGFEINFPNSQSLYSQESVSNFLLFSKYSESFEDGFNYIDQFKVPIPEEIRNALEELCAVDLEFDKKFDYISSCLKARKIQNKRYENAINIISEPIFEENKCIFIPCFAQNIFPKSYKDNSYISDNDKFELNCLTSLDKCRIEDEICRDFLLSNNNFFLSRSSAAFDTKYFKSPFVKLLNITEEEIKDLPLVIYSKKYGEYRLGIDEDNKLFFLQHSKCMKSLKSQLDINYRNYKNDYTNALAISPNDFLKLSYTSAKEYFKCPFSYYLNRILKISSNEENFNMKLGTLAHYVFERQFDEGFDFETVFEEGRNELEWEPGEDLLVERLKQDIKNASDASILHFKTYAKSAEVFTELQLQTRIDSNTLLEGKIDKIMLIDDSELMVVDYKTGGETFDRKQLEYGVSLQLPTYAYLLHNDDKFKDYHIAGLYINNVVNNGYVYERDDDEVIDSNLKLTGVTVANLESINKIDNSIQNGKSFFLKSITTLKNGELKKGSNLVGDEELKEMIDLTLEKYVEASEKIRNNEFEISPLFIENGGACKYCEHKDICFVKASQRRGKKDDDEDDENGDGMV